MSSSSFSNNSFPSNRVENLEDPSLSSSPKSCFAWNPPSFPQCGWQTSDPQPKQVLCKARTQFCLAIPWFCTLEDNPQRLVSVDLHCTSQRIPYLSKNFLLPYIHFTITQVGQGGGPRNSIRLSTTKKGEKIFLTLAVHCEGLHHPLLSMKTAFVHHLHSYWHLSQQGYVW